MKITKIYVLACLLSLPLIALAQNRHNSPWLFKSLVMKEINNHSGAAIPSRSYSLQKTTLVNKPGRRISYGWDSVSGSWKKRFIAESNFDTKARLLNEWQKDTLDKDTSSWSMYTYDAMGGYIKLNNYRNSGKWITYGFDSVVMDAKGRQIYSGSYYWNGTKMVFGGGSKSLYFANIKGNDTLNTRSYYENSSSAWVTNFIESLKYDANNYVKSRIGLYVNSAGMIIGGFQQDYTLNTDGSWLTVTEQKLVGKNWVNSRYYDSIKWYSFPENKVMHYFARSWNSAGSKWVDSSRYTATYDANGGYVSVEQVLSGTTWVNAERITSGIDSKGSTTLDQYESWNGTSWQITYASNYIFTYDANDNITRQIYQPYSTFHKSFVNSTRDDYSNFTTYTGLNEDAIEKGNISLYPNPVRENINIKTQDLKSAETIIIYIYNLQGQSVFQENYYSNSLNNGINIPVNHLPAGIYLLRTHTGSKEITRRFIKE